MRPVVEQQIAAACDPARPTLLDRAMAQRPSCPDCNRPMEEGFIIDETHGGRGIGSWVAGQAEKSIWTGIKMRGRRKIPILAMRCPRCGLLKLYVREA